MSTIAHPRSVPSGPSGKTVAGLLVGAVLAVVAGYGFVTRGEPVSGELSQPAGSDRVIAQQAAEVAAAKAAAVARGEHMQEINELGFGELAINGADQLFIQRAAELAAEQAALDRTEWMLEINELGYGAAISTGADQVYKQQGADLAATEEAQRRGERMFQINSFGWEPAKLENAGPRSPLVVE